MKLFLIIICLTLYQVAYADEKKYHLFYDYSNQGDDWYGHPASKEPSNDFYSETTITTLQGDDYCLGYLPSGIAFGQGPELSRTQQGGTSYEFYHEGGTLCLDFVAVKPPDNDLIFMNGFEIN